MLFLYKPWCLILLFVQQLCPNRSKLRVQRKEVTMQSMRNKKHNLFIFKPSARVGLIRSKKFFTGQNFSSTNPKIPVYNFQSQHFWHSEVWICVGSLGSFLLWVFCDIVETVSSVFKATFPNQQQIFPLQAFFGFQRSALCRWKWFWSISKWFIFSTLWYWRWTGTHKIVVFLYIISGTWSCFC